MYRISFFVAAILVICSLILISTRGNQTSPLPKPPELRARDHELSLTLHAVADSNGRDSFAYKGHDVAPILRVSPGDTLKIEYVNDLPAKAKGSFAISPCMDMTNLHFHGLHAALHRVDPSGSSAWPLLVSHPPAWREPPAGTRRYVRRHRD